MHHAILLEQIWNKSQLFAIKLNYYSVCDKLFKEPPKDVLKK